MDGTLKGEECFLISLEFIERKALVVVGGWIVRVQLDSLFTGQVVNDPKCGSFTKWVLVTLTARNRSTQ